MYVKVRNNIEYFWVSEVKVKITINYSFLFIHVMGSFCIRPIFLAILRYPTTINVFKLRAYSYNITNKKTNISFPEALQRPEFNAEGRTFLHSMNISGDTTERS